MVHIIGFIQVNFQKPLILYIFNWGIHLAGVNTTYSISGIADCPQNLGRLEKLSSRERDYFEYLFSGQEVILSPSPECKANRARALSANRPQIPDRESIKHNM